MAKASEDFIATYRGKNGDTVTLPIAELVVGDVIKIESGMRIPCDCILIDGTDIFTDESGLTGEPDAVEKLPVTKENYSTNPSPFLYAKTLVNQG